ncbi:hypothetical protein LNAOJCKE_4467 [Methylorubrum aminovorans]|uniref:Lysozyme inhibitor LprI N-terminal domain-containing protein n=1 Tax=Methylorubrum aminovorans TaxID=269069 RepID=A0ABQ4ULL8_9HYPH|nr:hypothetical protein LNAOJCKE_4467 [Methylorubrum aminovorans]
MQCLARALAILVVSGGLIGGAGAGEAKFYRGTHVCNGNLTLDDWEFSPADARFNVFFRRADGQSFQALELTAQSTADGLVLSDRRGRPWLALRTQPDGETLHGRWLSYQGRPQTECEPFTVERTESAKARMDGLFALFGEAEPTVRTARAAAAEQQRLPPIELLPELDQQAYRQRYAEAAPAFWKRFYEAERKRLADAPIATPEERERLVAALRAGSSAEATPQGSLERDAAARQSALDRLRLVADRLADQNSPLQPLPMDSLCERLSDFGYIDTERLELAVGLPVEAWNRAFTESLIQQVQSCKEGKTVVRLLTQSYPEIERRGRNAAWLREQRERLCALPPTLATLRDTNGLHLSQEELRRNDVPRALYERFVGAPLEPRRAELERAAVREIEDAFAKETPTSLPLDQARSRCQSLVGRSWGNDALSRLYKVCTEAADSYVDRTIRRSFQAQVERIEAAPKTFEGLRTNHWFLMDTGDLAGAYPPPALLAEFNAKAAGARAEAVRAARDEVEKAFAAADPMARTPEAPILRCGRDPLPSDETLRPLVLACLDAARAFETRREEARCKEALKASGAGDGLLAATIRPKPGSDTAIPVRQVVCGGARQTIAVTFPTSGMLWWSKQYMEVRLPNDPKRDEPRIVRWLIEPVSGKAEWAMTKLEAKTIDLPVAEELFLPCLARQGLCR